MQKFGKSLNNKECKPKEYVTLTAIGSVIFKKSRLMLDAY